jgi:hypothetical protein
MIAYVSTEPTVIWDWLESNCPSTTLTGFRYLDWSELKFAGFGIEERIAVMEFDFGSDDEEILFRLRWSSAQPRSHDK